LSARLIYGFDPLCGWCYGFAPALRRIRDEFPGLAIELRMGGLITGDRIRPYREAADYIKQASSRLTAVTGVALGEAFFSGILANPGVTASSLPPCDVLLQLRQSDPDAVLDVAAALQQAHFGEGLDLNDPATYDFVILRLGSKAAVHVPAPHELRPALDLEFQASRALGITSYPTLILDRDGARAAAVLTYDPATAAQRLGAMLLKSP